MSYPNWPAPQVRPQPGPPPRPFGHHGFPGHAQPPLGQQGFPGQPPFGAPPGPQPYYGPPPRTQAFHGAPQGWPGPANGGAPGPPRRGGGGGVLLGCGIALLVLFVGGLVVLFGISAVIAGLDPAPQPTPTRTTTPPSTTTTPPVEPSPSPAPPEPTPPPAEPTPPPTSPPPFQLPDRDFGELPPPHSDHPDWVTVQRSSLYLARFPVQDGCPAPAYVTTMAELEAYATPQLACIQNAWTPVLETLGLQAHTIPHYYYTGDSATSPCGTTTAPAFYCSAGGGAIYFGEMLLQGTSQDPIWAKDLVGHEYGHHLQALSGFFPAIYELPGGNEILRRLEIQATCLGFGGLRRDTSYVLDQPFYDYLEPHLRSFLDDGIHGSPDSLAYWGMRGFHATHAADCNTWVVGPEWVE